MLSIEVHSTKVIGGPIQVEMVISPDYIAILDILKSGPWSSIHPFANYCVYNEVSENAAAFCSAVFQAPYKRASWELLLDGCWQSVAPSYPRVE